MELFSRVNPLPLPVILVVLSVVQTHSPAQSFFDHSPKNFFAAFSVMTMEWIWLKAVAALPCTKGIVNMLKREESAYIPSAYMDLLPIRRSCVVLPLGHPAGIGNSRHFGFIAGPISPGVFSYVAEIL